VRLTAYREFFCKNFLGRRLGLSIWLDRTKIADIANGNMTLAVISIVVMLLKGVDKIGIKEVSVRKTKRPVIIATINLKNNSIIEFAFFINVRPIVYFTICTDMKFPIIVSNLDHLSRTFGTSHYPYIQISA
jgi:hypothetical protein